jgi:hypothetical protein
MSLHIIMLDHFHVPFHLSFHLSSHFISFSSLYHRRTVAPHTLSTPSSPCTSVERERECDVAVVSFALST